MTTYPYGQCTYYAASTNPWIAALPNLGNAGDWLANASKYGLSISSAPVPGSVMVLEPGTPGLDISSDGHVADVQSYNQTTGMVTVTDMNWNGGLGVVQTHTLPASAAAGYILPPSNNPNAQLSNAASLLSSDQNQNSGPSPWDVITNLLPNAFPALGQVGTAGGIAGSVAGNVAGSVLGPVLIFMKHAGEILVGMMFLGGGLYIIITHTKTGGTVVNVAQGTLRKGMELGAAAV